MGSAPSPRAGFSFRALLALSRLPATKKIADVATRVPLSE